MVRRLLKISVCTTGPNTSNNVILIQGDPVERYKELLRGSVGAKKNSKILLMFGHFAYRFSKFEKISLYRPHSNVSKSN